MLDPDVKIVKQTQDHRFDNGTTVPIIRVQFTVGPHGPFLQKFDMDGFTAAARDTALNAFATQVRTA
jgi:membrane protein YdbS with pleckstrin-like domain